MQHDLGFTHVALQARDLDASISFYARYAGLALVHERVDAGIGKRVAWLSDRRRPFALVLVQAAEPTPILGPFAHLGVGCAERADVDRLCAQARQEGCLARDPMDSGYPVGYWAFIRDPDGHILELSHGQEVALTVTRQAAS